MDYLKQGDPRWSTVLLGNGPGRIGNKGCVLASLAQAARILGTRPSILPPHANIYCLEAKAFQGDALVLHKAAPPLGLLAPLEERLVLGEKGCTHDDMVDAIERAMLARECALLRIDHDRDKTGGDEDGDHTICAFAFDDDINPRVVQCADPAVGALTIDWPTLERRGVPWKRSGGRITDERHYRVVGVRPIRRVPQ